MLNSIGKPRPDPAVVLRNSRAREQWLQLKDGKAEALEALFRTYYDLLFNYGVKFSGHEELTKDCIQETFAYIWERRTRLSLPESVKGYLLVAMRRQVLRALENKARHERLQLEYGNEQPQAAFSAEELLIFGEMADADQRRLRKAFDAIPERMREALYLKTFNSLRYREIAEIMEVSPQVARNYVAESLKRLRAFLGDSQ